MTVHQVSSFEMSPSSDKIPPSPFRAPPSPSRVPQSPSRYAMSPRPSRMGPLSLTMSQIQTATNNFSDDNQIGEGGFGIVYKGILEDRQVVAIKRAKKVFSYSFLVVTEIYLYATESANVTPNRNLDTKL